MKNRKYVKNLFTYLFLSLYGTATLFPFLWMVVTTFKSEGAIFEIPPKLIPDKLFKPGMWDNYTEVLLDYNFLLYLWNSTLISGAASFGQLITCSMAGFAFARMNFFGRGFLFTVLVAMMMIPVEVNIIPEFLMFSKIGWLDSYLPLIVPSFLVGSFGTFMLKEHYMNVPQSLEDAAVIDGCKTFQIYRHIFFPLSTAPLATIFVIAFMNNWNDLLRPVLYIQSPELRTVSLGLTQFQSLYSTDWNLMITGSVVSILPLIIVYLFTQRFIIDGMMTSGTKG
ncbi:carbohydrate ABC transporter permease [Paenibacillus alkaliterrae]|uniref:carbohydrate ABC transporter permease n=1 Tax=Paenibacillus alkaliterrae TaxID=320909 RepID=UPI001F18195A|nr:carbohydrate ABC transporter permease [Paenibacillus alkaliterrae]MCF2941320.1 carbohydrate ABC transporter permease [Paenibacillus alkaliterrae]